jgi:c-di-GMP-binding flagellar brake protein YcgR
MYSGASPVKANEVITMDTQKLLEPLTQLNVSFPDQPRRPYLSVIKNVTKTTLLIDNPFDKLQDFSPRAGQEFVCTIQHPDALYKFETQVLEVEKQGTLSLLVLKRPPDLRRIQRRKYYLLKATLPFHYRILPKSLARRPVPFKTVETNDISGGGLGFLSADTLTRETQLDLMIELPSRDRGFNNVYKANMIICVGKIVTEKSVGQQTAYGIEFEFIEEKDRERLINFIFEEQSYRMSKNSTIY